MDHPQVSQLNNVHRLVVAGAFFLAVFHGGLWLAASDFGDVPDVPDSVEYEEIARNLLAGKGYVLSRGEGDKPTLFREPGYPAFLALVYGIGGHHRTVVRLIQIVMFGVISLLTYVLAVKLLASRGAALAASLLTASSFSLASYSTLLMSENLSTLVLLLAVLAATRALKRDGLTFPLVTGGLLGFATLIKTMLFPLVFFLALIVFLDRGRTKSAYVGAGALILSAVLAVAPWSLRNYHQFGTFAVASRGGMALYLTTLRLDDPMPDLLRRMTFALSQELGRRRYPGQEDLRPLDYERVRAKRKDLTGRGMNEWEVDAVLFKEALARAIQRPVKHGLLAVTEFLNLAAFGDVELMVAPTVQANFPQGKAGVFVAKLTFRLVGYAVFLMALLALFTIPRRDGPWAVVAIVVGYTLIAYALIHADRRYVVPLVPLLNLLVVFCWGWWRALRSERAMGELGMYQGKPATRASS